MQFKLNTRIEEQLQLESVMKIEEQLVLLTDVRILEELELETDVGCRTNRRLKAT